MTDDYRSVSQVTQYEKCPHAYYLQRRLRVWEKPAAWTAQGTAFHAAIEAYERGEAADVEEMKNVFREVYAREINRMTEVTPNMAFWFDSRQGHGENDVRRRYDIGLRQVRDYHQWRTGKGSGDVIWVSEDGTPGIELRFDADFRGVKVRGFIDQILDLGDGRVHVRDAKSGNKPGEPFQLKVYGMALEQIHGVQAITGDFWMGEKAGKHRGPHPKKPVDLTGLSESEVIDRFHAVDEGIRDEQFDPKPGPNCWSCPVQTSCKYRK